jgi:hypothetical protein
MRVSSRGLGLCVAAALALVALVVVVPQSGTPARSSALAKALRLIQGIPVSQLDSPAGALAAADNYVALGSQSLEQDPSTFSRLVSVGYAPWARKLALQQAQALRASDSADMDAYERGARALAVIAARRLAGYTSHRATVVTWLAGFLWGGGLRPRQSWNLVQTTLDWRTGYWQVTASQTEQTAAPVPASVYERGANATTGAFERLNGMTAPFYGPAEG